MKKALSLVWESVWMMVCMVVIILLPVEKSKWFLCLPFYFIAFICIFYAYLKIAKLQNQVDQCHRCCLTKHLSSIEISLGGLPDSFMTSFDSEVPEGFVDISQEVIKIIAFENEGKTDEAKALRDSLSIPTKYLDSIVEQTKDFLSDHEGDHFKILIKKGESEDGKKA